MALLTLYRVCDPCHAQQSSSAKANVVPWLQSRSLTKAGVSEAFPLHFDQKRRLCSWHTSYECTCAWVSHIARNSVFGFCSAAHKIKLFAVTLPVLFELRLSSICHLFLCEYEEILESPLLMLLRPSVDRPDTHSDQASSGSRKKRDISCKST